MDQSTRHSKDWAKHDRLRALIAEHQVVYETWPAQIVRGGQLATIGHDIVLIGTHADSHGPMTPGCNRCTAVWQDLKELAVVVAPPPSTLSRYRIAPFKREVHYAQERGNRTDIELVLEIRHQRNYQSPVDDCETTCMNRTLSLLRELGVPRGRWGSRRHNR